MIEENANGWEGVFVKFIGAKKICLVGMEMKSADIDHIGILVEDERYGIGLMFHQSSSKGSVLVVIDKNSNNYWHRKAKKYKHLE